MVVASPLPPSRRISHSYCEAVVYDPDTEETTVTSTTTNNNLIRVKGPRARSVSMFEVVRELVPGIGEDQEGDQEGGKEHSLTDAIQMLGDNCPYKDLLQGQ